MDYMVIESEVELAPSVTNPAVEAAPSLLAPTSTFLPVISQARIMDENVGMLFNFITPQDVPFLEDILNMPPFNCFILWRRDLGVSDPLDPCPLHTR